MSTRGFIGYRYDGVIRGTFNHWDSYLDVCGNDMLDRYCALSQEQLRTFFLKCLSFNADGAADGGAFLREAQWDVLVKDMGTLVVKEDSEFLKDGLFCEYGYVFDLDSKKKRLMFFDGFGKKPSKGYKDYFYEGDAPGAPKYYYQKYVGAISGDLDKEVASYKMYMLYAPSHIKKFLREAARVPLEEVPLLTARLRDHQSNEAADDWKEPWIVEAVETITKQRLAAV